MLKIEKRARSSGVERSVLKGRGPERRSGSEDEGPEQRRGGGDQHRGVGELRDGDAEVAGVAQQPLR